MLFSKGFVTKLTSLVQLYLPRRRADVFLHAIIQVIVESGSPVRLPRRFQSFCREVLVTVVLTVGPVVPVFFFVQQIVHRTMALYFSFLSEMLYSSLADDDVIMIVLPTPIFIIMNEVWFSLCLQHLICNYDTATLPTP